MWQRRSALARLHEELSNIEVLDRIHDLAPDVGSVSERAYAIRRERCKQILDEIAKLKASKSALQNATRVTSAVVFVCALGYAALHFLLK